MHDPGPNPNERVEADDPQPSEHRGSQDVGRGDESPLREHDEPTTEYSTEGDDVEGG
ncbi:MAG TPA: hypothetical protein VFZ83_00110 [Acidimicrobiia bacterium]|nr:hypothetical protein [Acidimicrobiia bacterium]